MPFQTDPTWGPAQYRAAHAAWHRNAPANDNDVLPRPAAKTAAPRHGKLAKQLRALLAWRAASQPVDWTSVPVNDNEPDVDGNLEPMQLDTVHTIRPRISEMLDAVKDVEFEERVTARTSSDRVVAVGGDIQRGPVLSQAGKPPCIVRLGGLRLSNGRQTERALVRTETGVQMDDIRIPLAGIVDCKVRRSSVKSGETYEKPKGFASTSGTVTVGVGRASPGAFQWEDAVIEREARQLIRESVSSRTAAILDKTVEASSFRQVGEFLGYTAKAAERQGKRAVIAACAELDAAMAA